MSYYAGNSPWEGVWPPFWWKIPPCSSMQLAILYVQSNVQRNFGWSPTPATKLSMHFCNFFKILFYLRMISFNKTVNKSPLLVWNHHSSPFIRFDSQSFERKFLNKIQPLIRGCWNFTVSNHFGCWTVRLSCLTGVILDHDCLFNKGVRSIEEVLQCMIQKKESPKLDVRWLDLFLR